MNEIIEQLLQIAGMQEYTKTLVLSDTQARALMNAAYEAGQRDLSHMAWPEDFAKPGFIVAGPCTSKDVS